MPSAFVTDPPTPPRCDAAISRPTLDATTAPGDGNYGTPVGAVSTPAAQWTPQPYRSQLALLAQQPVELRFDGLVGTRHIQETYKHPFVFGRAHILGVYLYGCLRFGWKTVSACMYMYEML